MKIFPNEYGNHATALHKVAVVIAGILIAGTLLGMPAFLLLHGADFPLSTRKLLAFLIIGGAPAGLILVSTVNYSLGRRYRQYLLSLQSGRRANTLSSSREELFKRTQYTRYDYHNARQSFISAMVITAILYIILISWLYLTYAPLQPAMLVGFCFPLAWFGALWIVFSRRWQGSIILTLEGLQIEKDGHSQILPWDSLREIKNMRYGFLVKSDLTEFMIWNDISPADLPWKSFSEIFRLGEMRSKQLIDQIKAINPSIVHVEPFLSRNLQISISDRTIAKVMILIIILFVIVMILTMPESVGR